MYDDYSDGITPLDYEELEVEANDTGYQANGATGDSTLVVGVHPNGKWDYEVWVDGGEFGSKPHYFAGFEEVREAIKEKYPTANWEDVGW
jgi:hypothetical protein